MQTQNGVPFADAKVIFRVVLIEKSLEILIKLITAELQKYCKHSLTHLALLLSYL